MSDNAQIKPKKSSKLSWSIFIITISLVLISLVSVVFPALIVRTFSPIEDSPVNPLEIGALAVPLIITNLILLGIGLAYFRNKLPLPITKALTFIFNFEVSKKVSIIVIVAMLSIYISSSVSELGETEKWFDSPLVQRNAENWNIDKIGESFYAPFRLFLLSSSINLFDNIRVIPFIASIALVVLTFFITREIAHKRFAGLVAVAILLQSNIFLKYDTTSTYENFWTVLYIFSLYLIYKAWPLSPISYVLSFFSKPLTAAFLPMTFFLIYRAEISRQKKIFLALSYLIVAVIGSVLILILDVNLVKTSEDFIQLYFWQGFTSIALSLRFDYLILFFLLPLVVGLFLSSRKGILQADSIMVLIAGIIVISPILSGFTEVTNQPYRFIPLVVFFAMGVGIIFSKRESKSIPKS